MSACLMAKASPLRRCAAVSLGPPSESSPPSPSRWLPASSSLPAPHLHAECECRRALHRCTAATMAHTHAEVQRRRLSAPMLAEQGGRRLSERGRTLTRPLNLATYGESWTGYALGRHIKLRRHSPRPRSDTSVPVALCIAAND